jgi:ribosomal protein S27AE
MGTLKIACPRCRKGEVFIDHDMYGWYECCLQCGYTRDLPDIARQVGSGPIDDEKEKVRARKVRSLSIKKGM